MTRVGSGQNPRLLVELRGVGTGHRDGGNDRSGDTRDWIATGARRNRTDTGAVTQQSALPAASDETPARAFMQGMLTSRSATTDGEPLRTFLKEHAATLTPTDLREMLATLEIAARAGMVRADQYDALRAPLDALLEAPSLVVDGLGAERLENVVE